MNKKELSKQRFDAAAPQRAALSRNLRQLKEERKLTQDQLAEMTGLSLNEVARILKETVNPQLSLMVGLANGLGVPLTQLLDLTINPADLIRFDCQDVAGIIEQELATLPLEEQQHICRMVCLEASHFRNTRPNPNKLYIK